MKKNEIKISSNKSFGIVFFIFFLIVSIFPLIDGEKIKVWSLIVSLIFLILGLINSKFLTPLNRAWFKFGILLGNFVSPIIMGVVFFLIVTPTSIIMKLLGKNLLNLKRTKKRTYWIERTTIKSKMKNQF
jgi:cytochrome c oxidase subunit IV